LILCWWSCFQAGQVLLGELDQFLMGDTASADQNHSVSCVVCVDVVDQVFAADASDVLLRSQNGSTQGLVHIRSRVQLVEDDFLELLVNLF